MWLCAIILGFWEKCSELDDPTYNHAADTSSYYVRALVEIHILIITPNKESVPHEESIHHKESTPHKETFPYMALFSLENNKALSILRINYILHLFNRFISVCQIFFLQTLKVFFTIFGGIYLTYLALLIMKAYSELRSMPFFGKITFSPHARTFFCTHFLIETLNIIHINFYLHMHMT